MASGWEGEEGRGGKTSQPKWPAVEDVEIESLNLWTSVRI